MRFYLFLEIINIMNRHSKHRHQGDPVQLPGSLTEQINQDRSVVNKKNRQKQKRKHEDEEEDEQVNILLGKNKTYFHFN
jgi:hypothetical protein